jgi:hypothetical protein
VRADEPVNGMPHSSSRAGMRASLSGPALPSAMLNSILKFFQVDITGMFRMTSSARYLKAGVGSSRPN